MTTAYFSPSFTQSFSSNCGNWHWLHRWFSIPPHSCHDEMSSFLLPQWKMVWEVREIQSTHPFRPPPLHIFKILKDSWLKTELNREIHFHLFEKNAWKIVFQVNTQHRWWGWGWKWLVETPLLSSPLSFFDWLIYGQKYLYIQRHAIIISCRCWGRGRWRLRWWWWIVEL